MKRKYLKGMAVTAMTVMVLTACGSKGTGSDTSRLAANVSKESMQENGTQTQNQEAVEEKESMAEAKTVSAEDFVVTALDDGTVMLSRYTGREESIVIPSEVNGMTVTVIGEDTFMNHEELKSVVIPDTVVEIKDNTFLNCFNLESVVMSKNIEKIGTYAFVGSKYYGIELPETLKEIGIGAFSECEFSELVIPENLEKIERSAFSWTLIESVTIPSNIKIVEEDMFKCCKQLKKVVIKDGIEAIRQDAFSECDALESVTIPASVTEMTDPFYMSDNVTIYTPAGSYAETWAAENDIPCVAQ